MQPGMGKYCYLATPACPSTEVSVGLAHHVELIRSLLDDRLFHGDRFFAVQINHTDGL
jgi:hypothetical protein